MGSARLQNLKQLLTIVVREDIAGDAFEAGAWRGGAAIYLRGILLALGDTTRRVWCADSFEGLPSPVHPKDRGYGHDLSKVAELAVSLETVKANFARYDLLDDRVMFLKGWFKDTLPTAPVERISLLRLDGDYYDSTMDGLTALHPKVTSGGFVIIDDYGNIEPCRDAVNDYRRANNIDDEIIDIDGFGVYWRRT